MPRVIAPSVKIIFCEGRPGSLDDLLLTNLIAVGQTLIVPVGGKHSIRAFIDGYLGNYPQIQPDYLGFCDRDFDVEPPAAPQLIRLSGEKPIWFCHRASVENYLIDADLFRQYWAERENTPQWSYGPAPSIEEIERHILEAACELVDYQAIRWGLAKLKPGSRWPEIRTSWTKYGSGDLPSSLDYNDCLAQAHQLVESFQIQLQNVQSHRLEEYVKDYHKRFTNQDFLKNREYLIWFHGKDHLAQLCQHLAPNFPRRHYADWAAEHLDVSRHPDLQQLAKLAKGAKI